MMFNTFEMLRAGLNACVNQTLQDTDSPLVFAHACWGHPANASAMRMTSIGTKQDPNIPLARIVATTANREDAMRLHQEAFRRHIIRFKRSGTLLDWITRWMYENCEPTDRQARSVTKPLHFLVTSDPGTTLTFTEPIISISRGLLEKLDDRQIVDEYYKELYAPTSPPQGEDGALDSLSFAAQKLVGARFSAYEAIKTSPFLTTLGEVYSLPHVSEAERNWMFLGALQTAFMYVQYSHLEATGAHGFISVGSCYLLQENKPEDCPLGVISAVIPHPVDAAKKTALVEQIEEVLNNRLEKTVRDIDGHQSQPLRHRFVELKKMMGGWDAEKLGELERALQPLVTKSFPATRSPNEHPDWQTSLLLWLAVVLEGLRENLHEGNPLNFYFVVADRSQVLDSGLFEVLELPLPPEGPDVTRAQDALIPWLGNGQSLDHPQIEKFLDGVRRQIGKKNYAWFLDGKFALLWDATFPSRFPRGLIRFTESSWEVFLNQVYLRKKTKAVSIIPAMVYVTGGGAGGIILKGEHVASFRKGRLWEIGESDRGTRLAECLNTHLARWDMPQELRAATERSLHEALLAVSDDPHMGCMLAVFTVGHDLNAVNNVFGEMGEPWKTRHGDKLLEKSLDELTSLMAMDGATCIVLDPSDRQPKAVFRRLVKVPMQTNRGIDAQDMNKLDGEGSRKWSAAHAATREEISTVISVSQDGPIHIYEFSETERSVRICKLEEYPPEPRGAQRSSTGNPRR